MADNATLLQDHITLTCRSIDRIFLRAYVPKLQSVGQVCRFLPRPRTRAPGLALLDPLVPDDVAYRSPLASAWRQLDLTLNNDIDRQLRPA
jgi:hypothetical protein